MCGGYLSDVNYLSDVFNDLATTSALVVLEIAKDKAEMLNCQ